MRRLAALLAASCAIVAGPVRAAPMGSPSSGLAAQARTAAAAAAALDKRMSTVNYFDANGISNLSDVTQQIQDTIWAGYRAFLVNRAASSGLDDQFAGISAVKVVIPSRGCVTSPIVVFERTTLDTPAGLGWCGAAASSSGNASATSWDGSANKALANSYYPILQVVPGGNLGNVAIYAHDATARTGGAALGKNWTTSGFTVAAAGTGYNSGDLLTLPQWSRAPYVAATCTATTDGVGHLTGCTPVTQGIYAMPGAMQRRYLTAANGFTGAIAAGGIGKVFDPALAGAYVVGGGTGSGGELYATWTPDFAGDGTNFRLGAYTQMNMHVDYLDMNQQFTLPSVTDVSSATFGKKYGVTCTGLQININKVLTQGGYYGGLYSCTDLHVTTAQHNGAKTSMAIIGSGSVDIGAILDTWEVHALEVDNSQGVRVRARVFHNLSYPAPDATDPAVMLGSNTNSSANYNANVDLDLTLAGGFGSVSTAGLSCNWTRDSRVAMTIANANRDGSIVANPTTAWGTFASTCDASNAFTGSIDQSAIGTIRLTPGTTAMPAAQFAIFDGARNTMETGLAAAPINILKATRAPGGATAIWTTTGSPTIVDNSAGKAAPDGSYSAALVTFAGATDAVRQTLGGTGGTTPVCLSAWVYAGTNFPTLQFGLSDTTASNRSLVNFPSTTGAATGTTLNGGGAVQSYGFVQYPLGWVRLWVLATAGVSFTNWYLGAFPGTTAGTSFYLWSPSAVSSPRQCPSSDPAALRASPMPNVAVGTTATTIGYAERPGQLWTVSGVSGGASFSDVIKTDPGRAPTLVYGDTGVGAPSMRTYSISGGAVQMTMAAGTYTVTMTTASLP